MRWQKTISSVVLVAIYPLVSREDYSIHGEPKTSISPGEVSLAQQMSRKDIGVDSYRAGDAKTLALHVFSTIRSQLTEEE